MNMNKKINIGYILTYFFFHGLTAVVYGFGVYSLTERGFSSGEAGVVLAIANIGGFFLQALFSNVSDISKKFDTFTMSLVSTCLIILFSILNMFINTSGILLSIVFICMMSLYVGTEPLLNAFSGVFEKANIRINFAVVRAAGSLSYAIMCYVLGKLTVLYSYPSASISMLVIGIFLLIDLFIMRKFHKEVEVNGEVVEKKEKVPFVEFIKHNKTYMQLIFFLVLIQFAFAFFDNFLLLVLEPLGGNSGDMGTILSFKAIIEMLGMALLFPYLLKKMELEKILKLAALSYALKIIIQTFAPSILWIYVAQLLTCVSFSLMTPAMVLYVNKYISEKEATRGHAFFTMAFALGNIFASLFAGIIVERFGVKTMEYVASIVAIIGFIGFSLYINKNSKHAK